MKSILLSFVLVVVFVLGGLAGSQLEGRSQAAPDSGLWSDYCFYRVDFFPRYLEGRNFYIVTAVVGNYDGRWIPESYAINAAQGWQCQRWQW
jgi:hypothetical protein